MIRRGGRECGDLRHFVPDIPPFAVTPRQLRQPVELLHDRMREGIRPHQDHREMIAVVVSVEARATSSA
jgi:hypothetical protein